MRTRTIFLIGICTYVTVAVSMNQQLVPYRDRSHTNQSPIIIVIQNNNLSLEEQLRHAEKYFAKAYLKPESIWKGIKLIDVDKKNNFGEIFGLSSVNTSKQKFTQAIEFHSNFCKNVNNSSYVSLLRKIEKNNSMKQESMKRVYEKIEAANHIIQQKRDNCDFKNIRWSIFTGIALGVCGVSAFVLFSDEQYKGSVIAGLVGVTTFLCGWRRVASLMSLEQQYGELMSSYNDVKFSACHDLQNNHQQQ